jgi:dCMP deaminase
VKEKHIKAWVEACIVFSKLSNCPRRKFGALLVDPRRMAIIGTGYNGAPRGGGDLCGGTVCLRDTQKVPSGTRVEIGCHHAEMNVICNAAAGGIATLGAWLIVTGEPCLMCSKLIHHAGIVKVLVVSGGYLGENGVEYLTEHGVDVVCVDGPQDPRRAAFDEEARNTPVMAPEPLVDGQHPCLSQFGTKSCLRPMGHLGSHMSKSGSSWPRDIAQT